MAESKQARAQDGANAERASDLEQRQGRPGNSRDSRELSDRAQSPVTADPVRSSGHVPLEEEAQASAGGERTGSPGAEADQQAAGRGETR